MNSLPNRYPWAVRWIHWLSAILIAIAYLTSESAEELGAGSVNWHVLAGLGVLALFVPRLVARFQVRRPPQPNSRMAEKLMVRTVHLALLLFVVVQPVLGILLVWSEGEPLMVPITSWQIPPLLAVGEGWEVTLEDLHETVGNLFYGVIGLHALAALWHHFGRRDSVLRRML